MLDLSQSTWLSDFVDAELAAYDPAQARLKLPPELRTGDPDGPDLEARARTLLVRALRPRVADAVPADPLEAFARPIREHVQLLLDIALVLERPWERERRRAELAMLFAALGGDAVDAVAADPAQPHRRSPGAVRRAFAIAAGALVERGWPPGDPRAGLPLRAGLLSIERRHLARLAIDYHRRGRLDEAPVRRRLAQARVEAVVLFEALASAAAAGGVLDRPAVKATLRQLRRLDLPRPLLARARASLVKPRPADELARGMHARLRPFVLQQMLVAGLAGAGAEERDLFVEAFAAEAGVPREELAAIQAEAAVLYATEQRWLEPQASGGREGDLAAEWHDTAEDMVEKVATAFSENLEALVTELKETGELTQLLAKAAAGHTLTREERVKVKNQLIDVAKAVPALAIFAAPGGMLLLPLLAKVLPFNMLPSSWEKEAPAAHARPALPAKTPPTPPKKPGASEAA